MFSFPTLLNVFQAGCRLYPERKDAFDLDHGYHMARRISPILIASYPGGITILKMVPLWSAFDLVHHVRNLEKPHVLYQQGEIFYQKYAKKQIL